MPSIQWQQVPEYYHNYLRQVPSETLQDALRHHRETLVPFLSTIPEEKWDYRYAEGKWTIREVVQHIIDTERIMDYRALTIARGDTVALPGFDENAYTPASRAYRRSKESLIRELESVQQGSIYLFESFDEAMLEAKGVANNNPIYVEGIAYIIVGHGLHHLRVLKERYLQETTMPQV